MDFIGKLSKKLWIRRNTVMNSIMHPSITASHDSCITAPDIMFHGIIGMHFQAFDGLDAGMPKMRLHEKCAAAG